jgi:pyruvate kinase
VHFSAILLDTQGPEIRTGSLSEGTKHVEGKRLKLVAGKSIRLVTDESQRNECSSEQLFISYPSLATTLSVGMQVLHNNTASLRQKLLTPPPHHQ